MHLAKTGFKLTLVLVLVATNRDSQAAIMISGSGATLHYGYHTGTGGGLDADTLHYWSLNETAVPFADTGSSTTLINMAASSGTANPDSILQAPGGPANRARQIGTTGTGTNRITAFTAAANTSDNITAAQANSLHGPNGAISIDMLLRPDFSSTLPTLGAAMRLICQENEENRAQNLFLDYNNQSDLLPGGSHQIEFKLGGAQVAMIVPFTGPNALAAGSWYHLGVIYTGDATGTDNVKFYWTKVNGVSDTTTSANLVSTATLSADPVELTAGPEFVFGNETNGASNKSWFGALDEIRISGIDRDPLGQGHGFIFVPEANSVLIWLVVLTLMGVGSFYRRGQCAE